MNKNLLLLSTILALSACNDSGDSTISIDSTISTDTLPTSNVIITSITMAEAIPTTFTIDYAATADHMLEREWSVMFDMDDSMDVSVGDILVGIREAKQPGEIERTVNINDLQADILQYTSVGTQPVLTGIGVAKFSVSGNTISFYVDRNWSPDLLNIDHQTQLHVDVLKSTPSIYSIDYIPDATSFTQLQDNSLIPDQLGDYLVVTDDGTDTPVDIAEFSLQIIE